MSACDLPDKIFSERELVLPGARRVVSVVGRSISISVIYAHGRRAGFTFLRENKSLDRLADAIARALDPRCLPAILPIGSVPMRGSGALLQIAASPLAIHLRYRQPSGDVVGRTRLEGAELSGVVDALEHLGIYLSSKIEREPLGTERKQ